ncbi:MAG: hypothetical protein EOM87_07605 [Clostridia bacterium]|nr:hypothetical protein [Clostridia bacterium]
MSVQKRDINLFKAAGGERAKAKKRPLSTYMMVALVIVIVAVIGAIAYFNYTLTGLRDDFQNQQTIRGAYDLTISETSDLVAQYQAVVSEIYQAEKINEYLNIRSSRYTKATSKEVLAIRDGIVNSNTAYTYALDIDLKTNGQAFLEKLDKTNSNYDILYGALAYLIDKQKSNRTETIWYDYFRGQMVIVFSGGLVSGINLQEFAASMYGGILFEGVTYEPFMDLQLNGEKYVDARYMAASIDGNTVYNIMLLTMKSVEERAIDTLEASANRMYAEAILSNSQDDFRYEINKIEYDNNNGLLSVEITIIESAEFKMKTICDDLDASEFFEISGSVVSPPMYGIKTLLIVLEISGAAVVTA